ncbi:MAG TPA: DUF5667 domain-containing protein [Chloroflexia bacterium]|nr:DUF5667 domain-containing protein [Chloroflexia bacterium]
MAKTTAELVDEALNLILSGQLHLEECPRFYEEEWPAMLGAVEVALQVNSVSHPAIVSQRPFKPLDKTAGWNNLRSQIVKTQPVPPLTSLRAPQRPALRWSSIFPRLSGTRLGRAALAGVAAIILAVTLTFAVGNSLPGDWLYRAKLGWEYIGEVTSLSPDDRAAAALNYANNRLNELEKLAFVGKPDQVAEAEGQYLRGLDASLQYTNYKNFSAYVPIYNLLNVQRDRVFRLQQIEYALGPRSQISNIIDRLDYGVFKMKPKQEGVPPVIPTPSAATVPPADLTPLPTFTPSPTGK